MSEASDDRQCRHGDFGSRDVTVRIHGGDVNVTHVECGKPVWLDHEFLISEKMPMTLTYSVDEGSDEAYQVLKPRRPAEQPQDDGDVRAVRALTQAASRMLGTWAEANDDVRRELWTTLHDRADDVFDRFREQYAALDAKAPRERVAELAEHAEEER